MSKHDNLKVVKGLGHLNSFRVTPKDVLELQRTRFNSYNRHSCVGPRLTVRKKYEEI